MDGKLPIPPDDIKQALEACRTESLQAGSTFHHAIRLFPGDTSLALHTLYVFCRRVDDAVDDHSNPDLAHELLNGIHTALHNEPDEPLWTALSWVRSRWDLPITWFEDLITGARGDIGPVRIQTVEELNQYCYRVAGTVGLMILHVMETPDRTVYPYSLSLARAFQITNILRDLTEDHQRDRCYVPADWLREAHAYQDWEAAQMTENLRTVLRRLVRLARFNYRRARHFFNQLPKPYRTPIAVMTASYGDYLNQLSKQDFPSFDSTAQLSWIAGFRILTRLARIPVKGYEPCLPTS